MNKIDSARSQRDLNFRGGLLRLGLIAIALVLAVSCGDAGPVEATSSTEVETDVTASSTPTTTSTTATTTTRPTTSTTKAPSTTTSVISATNGCPDCPDWASAEDIEYVSALRTLSVADPTSFVSRLSDFEAIDMGQRFCEGLTGSYDGSFDVGLTAIRTIYDVSVASGGHAVFVMEQAVRIYCPEFTDVWVDWRGSPPLDPFS